MAKDKMTWHVTLDNTALVLMAKENQVKNGLAAIGAEAVTYAQGGCPVDTGRLRNSISYMTQSKQGGQNSKNGEKAKAEDYAPRGLPDKNSVYIGTNVEYAPAQEYLDMTHKTGGPHFIKNAAANHGDRYKELMEAALKV